MIRRLVFLSMLAAVLVVGDISARAFVETKAAERAQIEAPPGAVVTASIGGFPFVPPLLLGGSVNKVAIHLENVTGNVLAFASVDVRLRGVELDRNQLLSAGKVRVLDIDRGTVDVVITEKALTDALRVPVTIADGAVSVEILGKSFAVTPSVTERGRLTLTGAAGRALTLRLPKLDYVPCFGDVTVFAGRMRFRCEITNIPPALVDAVEQAS